VRALPDPEELKRRFVEFFSRRPEAVAVYIFGSAARGGFGPGSDFDVGVYLDPERAPLGEPSYKLRLLDELVAFLRFERVDLAILNDSSIELQHEAVFNGERVYCRDEGEALALESLVLRKWWDWQIDMREFDESVLRELAGDGEGADP